MNLFNTVIAQPGESVLSFIRRLGEQNGFLQTDEFYSFCVSPTHESLFSGYAKSFVGDPSGVNESLNVLSDSLPEGHLLHDDPKSFYLKHSLFPIYSMFHKNDKQKNEHIDFICYGKGERDSLWTSSCLMNHIHRKICYCKECFDEDMKKYGEPLIHLAHQIVGVCVCPVHNTPLWYSCLSSEEFSYKGMKVFENYNYVDHSLAYQYAVMCKELLENPVSTTINEIEETISNTMDELPEALWLRNPGKEDYCHNNKTANLYAKRLFLLHAARDTVLIDGITGEGHYRKKFRKASTEGPQSYVDINYGNKINLGLVLLFILFRKADLVRRIIENKGHLSPEDKALIAVNLLTDEYSVEKVESVSYSTYITLKHEKCGTTTPFTARKFINGDRCPLCSNNNQLEEVLKRETNWIVRKIDDSFIIRGNRDVKMSEKEMLQEINRPFLSPIIELTKEERNQAHAEYRADEIKNSDDKRIKEAIKSTDSRDVYGKIRELYPNEDYLTVKVLADRYEAYLVAMRFSVFMEVI